jgi:Copper resistance protein B precursor (CopB)
MPQFSKSNVEVEFRLRYELNRKFAPYIGVSYDESFFGTAGFVRKDGGNPARFDLWPGCGCGTDKREMMALPKERHGMDRIGWRS